MTTPQDEHFWNTLANYDEEIISIFKDADAARPLVETITRHIDPGTVVADLGCRPGNLLPFLKDAKRVYAVDKSANMLAHDRRALAHPSRGGARTGEGAQTRRGTRLAAGRRPTSADFYGTT